MEDFQVEIKEIERYTYQIRAESESEAIKKAYKIHDNENERHNYHNDSDTEHLCY